MVKNKRKLTKMIRMAMILMMVAGRRGVLSHWKMLH